MLRPEDVEQSEQTEQKSSGLGGLIKGIFGGGVDGSKTTQTTTGDDTASTAHAASMIAQKSKEGRGSVTTSTTSSKTAQTTNTYSVDTKESDEGWDQARALTAQAQKEGRTAQVKTVEASAAKREAAESMRRVEIARGAEHELQAKLADINPELGEAEYKKTNEKYVHAKKAAAGKRSELERLERELGDLNADVNRKVSFLQGQVDTAKSAKAGVDDVEAKIARLKKAVQEQEEKAAANQTAANKLKDEIASVQEGAKAERGAFDKAQLRVKELLRQLDEAKRAAEVARGKLAGAEHRLEDSSGKLSDYEDAAKHHASEAQSLKGKIPDLLECKDAALAKHKIAQSKLDTASKDAKAKTDTLEEGQALARGLKDVLLKTQDQSKAKAHEVACKKADFEKAEADLKPLQAERERQRSIVITEEKNAKELEMKSKSYQSEANRAQAKKEELWEKAKTAGEKADQVVDDVYVKLGGDSRLTNQGKRTEHVATESVHKKDERVAVPSHLISTKAEE